MAAMFKALESSDAVTHEHFLLMMAIHFGLEINWSKIMFDILKGMVTKTSKKAKGAAQICTLLKSAPNLTMGEMKTFPPLKILTAKTVGTYVAKQKGIDDGNEGDESVMATTALVKKKPVTKKRTAPTTIEPVAKKKRATVGRAAPAEKDLAMVPVVQNPEPMSVVPAATPKAPHRRAPKRKLVMQKGYDDESVDSIIHLVIADINAIELGEPVLREKDLVEPGITRSVEIGMEQSIAVNDEDDNLDGAENEIARKMASFTASKQFLKEPLRSDDEDNDMSGFKQTSKIIEMEEEIEKETDVREPYVVEPVMVEITETVAVDTEEEKETDKKEIEPVATEEMSLEKCTDSEDTQPLSKVLALTIKSTSDEESIPIDDLLAMIPVD
ncbi:splicing factor 3B subunit 1-like [Dorcoceras hygrometricum]|uniref:Splicing factor 3B subunit 1-like n=1 Tax=Dorcoceras hygrometricum TaxID=472368 RepID=A0A2Z7CZT1_9LAMI|nr:splicing factor 3B subunit 1-like [Dorcoceras hygrometricum]